MADQAELAVRLSLDNQFSKGISNASRSLGKFEGDVKRVGKGTGQLARGAVRSGAIIGAAVGGAFIYAAKQAIDFEDAFAGVRKTINEADLQKAGLSFDELAKSFRNMATEIPIAATELARIGETAGALGIPAREIETFTKTVALLGETTNLTSDEAAESLGKVTTILGLTGHEITDFADTLVNLGNQGASTESEIIEVVKRFAAMGKQAGLTTNQITALASAATSLGAEPEAAGSALSRIFSNMSTEIAKGSDKAKAFASITGLTIKQMRQRVNKGQALPLLMDFLKGLKGLNRTQAAKALSAAGITNVRDRDAILKMAQNLGFVNDQLQIAEESTGALGKEAQKRFDTVASKLKLLRNGFIEAAITVGEGFTPAVGRAAQKLTAFLKEDENKKALRSLGEDIGKFIDDIDWGQVVEGGKTIVSVLRTAGDMGLRLLEVISKLPKEILAVGGGALVLNKLSGGLLGAGVGNIFAGLAGPLVKNLAASIPIFGRAFVQPVFVTNMPLGGGVPTGGGGVAGAAGKGIGALGKVFLVGEAIGLTVAVNEVRQQISDQSTAQATAIQQQTNDFIASQPSTPALERALAGVETGIHDLEFNPLHVLVQGEALEKLRQMRESLKHEIADRTTTTEVEGKKGNVFGPEGLGQSIPDAQRAAADKITTQVETMKGKLAGDLSNVKSAIDQAKARANEAAARLAAADARTRAQVASSGAAIVGAIHAIPPPRLSVTVPVNVSATTVNRQYTVVRRYGPTGGSRYNEHGPTEFDP